MRLNASEASHAALLERLQVMEERILNLEMRLTARPH